MLEAEHAYLYLGFQENPQRRAATLPLDHAVLAARSDIAQSSDFGTAPRPATAPDEGHGSARFTLGLRSEAGYSATEIRLRPAYHDRLDPPGGYMTGGEIEFLDLGLLAGAHGVRLADLRLLSVEALALRSDILRPISWQVSTGVRRYGMHGITAAADGTPGGFVEGGPGLAWALAPGVQTYVFALSAFDLNADVGDGYALQTGPRVGIAAQPQRWLSLQLDARWLGDVAGGGRPFTLLRLDTQLHAGVDNGLRLSLIYGNDQQMATGTLRLAWEHYF
jgi:hypothetical protein